MRSAPRAIAVALVVLGAILPSFALAFPFGGQTSTVVPCYNQAIFARVGAPNGGDYIWTPSTKTYEFGPPSFSGQWLLGLASAPYYCVVSIEPVIVWSGIAIDMMGSSGSAAPSIQDLLHSTTPTTATPPTSPTPLTPSTTNPTTIGHVVISEVYYNVDNVHGSNPLNQWIELYNGSTVSVDMSGWTIQNSTTQTVLPSGLTLSPSQFLVVEATSNTSSYWNIPSAARVITLGALSIDGGLSSSDGLLVKTSSGVVVDAVSWGSNTTAFNPPVSASLLGYSLARKGLSSDTNTASDWSGSTLPKPGQ
jgi:hypothetical protein